MVMNTQGQKVALDALLTDISIDIETLSTHNDALILQLGIVGFNPETFEMGPKVNINFDFDLSMAEGFSITGSTLYWWLKQDSRAGATLETNLKHPAEVCESMFKYIQKYTVGCKEVKVWGNGAAFDNVIVKNYFNHFKKDLPWMFWNDRCARTLFNLYPNVKRTKPKIAHVAGYDAVAQAETIMSILAVIREQNEGKNDE